MRITARAISAQQKCAGVVAGRRPLAQAVRTDVLCHRRAREFPYDRVLLKNISAARKRWLTHFLKTSDRAS
jgi:hypothetical protein